MKPITEEQLKQITDLADGVPEQYREKCFELLLSHSLQALEKPAGDKGPKVAVDDKQEPPAPPEAFVLPIDVRAFLSQYGITEDKLAKIFFVEGEEIRPVYHLTTTKKAVAQIQYALLMALENALSTGQFQVELEELRLRCQEEKCYDSGNFMSNLKKKSTFKTVSADEPLVLSPGGKSDLADLIEELTND